MIFFGSSHSLEVAMLGESQDLATGPSFVLRALSVFDSILS